ncbi:MAG: sugar-binding protein [Bacteroidia bacterium]|jgi:Carbohydrate family 9 binding domain-like/Secretion system C-terminal sorting domain
MKFQYTFLPFLLISFSINAFCQTQKDTIFAPKAIVPVVIDGNDNDAVWSKTDWKPINQVWIPYAAKMAQGDFEGKYKVAWDSLYLYVLVHVVDDVLSDDHPDPLQNWWDDDCVEVFLDENRSKGDHLKNNNAFAYHVSTKYDAIDMDSNGNGVNYKKNIIVKIDTIGLNTYLWEMAIKVYSAAFILNNPEASRVKLTAKKLMGLTLAYCDNDNDPSKTRENFIGSMFMTAATANDNYITADYFGSCLLVDQPRITQVGLIKTKPDRLVRVYPNPAKNRINIAKLTDTAENIVIEIRSLTGALVKTSLLANRNQSLNVSDLTQGVYLLTFLTGNRFQTERIVKQ